MRQAIVQQAMVSRRGRSAGRVDPVEGGQDGDLTGRLGTLAQLARELGGVATFEAVLEVAAEFIRVGLCSATVSLSRMEPGTGTLRTLLNVGELGPSEQRWPPNETYSIAAYRNWREIVRARRRWTVTLDDPDADAAEVTLLRELGKHAAMAAPLVVNDTLWGELYVTYADTDQTFLADDEAYLEVYRAILESALARILQVQSLERLAYHDPLTGLANRRALDAAAAAAFTHLAAGQMVRVSAVAFDLNGLKRVNDQSGHAEGDRLILSAAALLQAKFNALPGSLAARTGGDEFVVLVPGHSPDAVTAIARAACAAIAQLPLGEGASCGIATAADPAATVRQLFQAADAALYRSKTAGHQGTRRTSWPS